MTFILVDVEAIGLSPHSGVMTEFGAVELKTRASFHGILYDAIPDPENPAKPYLLDNNRSLREQSDHEIQVMYSFNEWVNNVSWSKLNSSRPIFVSDNNGYDFQWINYYFDKTIGNILLATQADVFQIFGQV